MSEPNAKGLRFPRGRIMVLLDDGRRVSSPLKWYPTLQRATPKERRAWRMIGRGVGFHWAKFDLDLSTEGLVYGWKEGIPKPPYIPGISPKRLRRRLK